MLMIWSQWKLNYNLYLVALFITPSVPYYAPTYHYILGEATHCQFDHRCGLGVISLLLTHRARVQSPVESVSWLRFFRGFPLTVRQMSGNLGYIRPRLSYGHHISSKSCIIRLRTATVSDHSCNTWPSLHKLQHDGEFESSSFVDMNKDY